MPSQIQGYTTVQPDENLDSSEHEQFQQIQPPKLWSGSNLNIILFIALFLSVITNFVLSLLHWPLKSEHSQGTYASAYGIVNPKKIISGSLMSQAGMTRTISVPYTLEGPYSVAKDRERADKLWADLDIDAGVVALSDSYVSEKGLPEAMRFPWDDTKGVYFVNAFHNLHCLKKIYRALNEYDRGMEQSGAFPHVVHCLDTLRQDVLCSADDTPRYAVLKKETPTGGGQYRQCRDWTELEAWAKEQTACWKYLNSTDPNMNQLERFKYCPEGSPYLENARNTFPDAGLSN